jgi:hypothetical protein
MVSKSNPPHSNISDFRFSFGTAVAVVAAYAVVVIYGLGALDRVLRPLVYMYQSMMGPH